MTVGEYIKEYRTENKINQSEFARKMGCSRGYIWLIEKGTDFDGKKITVSTDFINKLAEVTSIDIGELYKKIDYASEKKREKEQDKDDSIEIDPELYCRAELAMELTTYALELNAQELTQLIKITKSLYGDKLKDGAGNRLIKDSRFFMSPSEKRLLLSRTRAGATVSNVEKRKFAERLFCNDKEVLERLENIKNNSRTTYVVVLDRIYDSFYYLDESRDDSEVNQRLEGIRAELIPYLDEVAKSIKHRRNGKQKKLLDATGKNEKRDEEKTRTIDKVNTEEEEI